VAGFHARYSARGRQYRYTIWNAVGRDVFARKFRFHWKAQLDATKMDEAARSFLGQRDFAAFCGTLRGRDRPTTTERTLYLLRCQRDGHVVTIDAAADAFLPHMVRNFVGTLLLVGNGKLAATDVQMILDGRDPQKAGPTAPPHGLCLTKVWYD
jgi:tRNA pseudouridine38-40 synthase